MFDLFNEIKPCVDWNCVNSFALWISAVGMVTISAMSLWLAIKDKLISVDGIFRLGIIPSDINNRNLLDRNVFILSFVNIGRRKVKIDNFKMCIKVGLFKNNYLLMFPQLEESLMFFNTQFPIRLDEMENKSIFFDESFFINIKDKHKNPIFDGIFVFVWYKIHTAYFLLDTSIGKLIKIKMDKESKKKLWKQYKNLKKK